MTTDWTAFDRLLASRRRTIVESFADFLRLNSVSQEPDKVRATANCSTSVWLKCAPTVGIGLLIRPIANLPTSGG